MELEYDVLVTGAGRAGSTATRYAADSGADVLLIEMRHKIGSLLSDAVKVYRKDGSKRGLEPSIPRASG